MTDDEGGELAAGVRPTPLAEGRPQGKVERHSGIGFELVLALVAPVLQMVGQPVEVASFFSTLVPVVAEQVIEVPKISLQRAVLIEPQMAEQLVDVPTVPCFVEPNADTPVSGSRGVPSFGGLQGFLPEQSFSPSPSAEQIIDIPVSGRGASGVLQGFHPVQSSSQLSDEQNVDIPVPRGWSSTARRGSCPWWRCSGLCPGTEFTSSWST